MLDDARFCARCGQPGTASGSPPENPVQPPKFLAGIQNMMESRVWAPGFKELLTQLRPRLVEAWGPNFAFDNGLAALLSSARHKGGDFIEFCLFFDQRGGVLKPSPEEYIRWRSGITKWQRAPGPRLERGNPLRSELDGILEGMGCTNILEPKLVEHHVRRLDPAESGPAWFASFTARWKSGGIDGRTLLAGLDGLAHVLAGMQAESMATVGTLAT